MAEQVRACAICGDNKATMHLLPKKEELRKKWLEFVFGTPPAKYNSNLVLCSNHFDHSDFSNFGAYSSGFASRLFIKPGSVPSRRSTNSSQTTTSQTLVTPPIHTSTQTDPSSLSCRATLLSMGTLGHPARSKGTQTESFMKSMSISTSTSDAPWGPATSVPLKHVHPRPAKRPRVVEEEEEDESDIFTIRPEPQDSYDPPQSMNNVTESLQPRDMSSTGYKDSKCIVFEKNLMELFETCPVCSRVSDVRTYKRGTYLSVVQKCNHCQYSKQWKSQPVMAAPLVEKILTNKRVLSDVEKQSSRYQTSTLEAFHCVILGFTPKSVVFSFIGMLYRLYLAAIPFNENTGHTQARTTSEKLRYRLHFPKAVKGGNYVKPVKSPPTHCYVYNLKAVVFEEIVPNPQSYLEELLNI